MAKSIYNLALVGCGNIARTGHVPAILRHPRFRLAALCDLDLQRAARLAALVPSDRADELTVTSDYTTLRDRPDIHAFVLAVQPQHSVDIAIDLLNHHKPILDEKPLARSLDHGQRLARTVQRLHAIYQVGFVFRYCRFVRDVAQAARLIGAPALYEVDVYDERLDPRDQDHYNLIQNALKTSSVPTHEGSHVVDFFRFWNPSPMSRVWASAIKTRPEFAGPNLWSCVIDLADGSVLRMNLGWFMPDLPPFALRMAGPGGQLQADMHATQLHPRIQGTSHTLPTCPLAQDWQAQLDTFATAIDQSNVTHATADEALAVLRTTIACEISASTRQPVWLSDFPAASGTLSQNPKPNPSRPAPGASTLGNSTP